MQLTYSTHVGRQDIVKYVKLDVLLRRMEQDEEADLRSLERHGVMPSPLVWEYQDPPDVLR